jgi:hypothetical protein
MQLWHGDKEQIKRETNIWIIQGIHMPKENIKLQWKGDKSHRIGQDINKGQYTVIYNTKIESKTEMNTITREDINRDNLDDLIRIQANIKKHQESVSAGHVAKRDTSSLNARM